MTGVGIMEERQEALDPSRAVLDPALPWLESALDPVVIEQWIAPLVANAEGQSGGAQLRETRLVRHKPGRRCVVYYEFSFEDREPNRVGVYGKIRARSADTRTQALLAALRRAGLRHDAVSRIAVPEPIGVLPEFHMALQRRAAGRPVSQLVPPMGSRRVMEQVAGAIHALHRCGVAADRSHTMESELNILEARLESAIAMAPHWGERIEKLQQACRDLATRVDQSSVCGIHRDFYPDQILIRGSRLSLLDLDLYASGDPALDVGNFSAHLTEVALRRHCDPRAFADLEQAFEESYLALSPEVPRTSIRIYRILTLARHIHLSMTIEGRGGATGDLIAQCEEELASLPARGA